MSTLGIPKKFIRLVRTILKETKNQVVWNGERQDDLCNEHQCIAFADDLIVIAKFKEKFKRTVAKLEINATTYGLKISEKKTKFMIMRQTEEGENILQINTEVGETFEFERIDEFVYLGV